MVLAFELRSSHIARQVLYHLSQPLTLFFLGGGAVLGIEPRALTF
jgi:hypothetical protein